MKQRVGASIHLVTWISVIIFFFFESWDILVLGIGNLIFAPGELFLSFVLLILKIIFVLYLATAVALLFTGKVSFNPYGDKEAEWKWVYFYLIHPVICMFFAGAHFFYGGYLILIEGIFEQAEGLQKYFALAIALFWNQSMLILGTISTWAVTRELTYAGVDLRTGKYIWE